MKRIVVLGFFALSVATLVLGVAFPVRAIDELSITWYEGTVTQLDDNSETVTFKTDDGAEYTFRVTRWEDMRTVAVGDRVRAEAIPNWGVVQSLEKIPVPRAGAPSRK